ncbi:MAG: hypothetical protein E7579_05935 [Ruminococcaceae bacterium]|nr:hypothetical protein [Oscillospiraceae bacterium]
MKQQNKRMPTSQLQAPNEKIITRYIFACVANILYVMPGIMCLAFGILSDGFSAPFLIAIITALLAVPTAFTGLYCYKIKKGRPAVLAVAAVQLAMHVVSACLVTAWYLILAPAFILTLILIATSKVIENH